MADKLFLSHIDLNRNELKNALIHKVDTMPSNPKSGQIVYWVGTAGTYIPNKLYSYNGSAWVIVGAEYTNGDGLSLTGNSFAVDGTVVRTSGNQTIGGIKSFTDNIKLTEGKVLSIDGGATTYGEDGVDANNSTWGVTAANNIVLTTQTGFIKLATNIGGVYLNPGAGQKAYYYIGTVPSTMDATKEIAVKGDIPTLPSNIVTGTGLTADKIVLGNGNSTVKTSSKSIVTTLGTDDTSVPTSKAAKTYIDTQDSKLSDRIDNISTLGRYLTGWDMATGTPTSLPLEATYTLQTGDYFIITNVPTSGTMYKPNQTGTWTTSTPFAKTTVTGTFKAGGIWKFNGTIWEYQETGAPIGLQPFTNTTMGGIKGKQVDGYVEADGDGFGKVYGWSSVVKTTGAQRIAGEKTFSDHTNFDNDVFVESGHGIVVGVDFKIENQSITFNDGSTHYGVIKSNGGSVYYLKDTTTVAAQREIAVKDDFTAYQLKVAAAGSTTKPVYVSAAGVFSECSTYAGGTAVTLNGTSKAGSTAAFYAPTAQLATGTGKYYLVGADANNSISTIHTHANTYISNGALYSENKKVLTDHQSLANYVTLDGAQTISGQKTFSNDILLAANKSINIGSGSTIYGPSSISHTSGDFDVSTGGNLKLVTTGTGAKAYYYVGTVPGTMDASREIAVKGDIPSLPDAGYFELALTFTGSGGEYSEVIKTTAPIQIVKVSTHEQVDCKVVYSYTNGNLSGATITMNADSAPTGYAALCIAGSSLA